MTDTVAPVNKPEPESVALAVVPYGERAMASASYFMPVVGLWLVGPFVFLLWKGRSSRFVAFHAVQAMLLQVALIPVCAVGVGVSMAVLAAFATDKYGNTSWIAPIASMAVWGVVLALPSVATLWMGFAALKGQPRSLPLLGRLAKRLMPGPA